MAAQVTASFLSDRRDKFVSDGKGNFSLRHNGHHEPPPAHNDVAAGPVEGGDAAYNAAPPSIRTHV